MKIDDMRKTASAINRFCLNRRSTWWPGPIVLEITRPDHAESLLAAAKADGYDFIRITGRVQPETA